MHDIRIEHSSIHGQELIVQPLSNYQNYTLSMQYTSSNLMHQFYKAFDWLEVM